MKRRRRIYYSETQKALMWERWRNGESLQKIAQLFDRNHLIDAENGEEDGASATEQLIEVVHSYFK
ncbi:hypothetical protein SAMN05192563_1004422 [Paraburkholderia aspalathi]|uniref:Transposase n=1 Tax=Paraburkholderia aspalathi TaxID=1324617 RepID=A0A1I7BEZ7_9BURK|nr:hypothetical protein [Paraburkholderia aspalathi]SFT85747.1 hypothetical protein SAMN05192563_1004422 [Paraburkholderia aspalathi]